MTQPRPSISPPVSHLEEVTFLKYTCMRLCVPVSLHKQVKAGIVTAVGI